ncbi:MAG: tRNA (adenosine(37)-N6)-threonylcarbamoyltransferase complex ATPase subunit type 1 TsaE [Phycisphaerales bacterium]|nr:tRNA (adenosine(37)-N6)-threonylcarbamoyltransferase complex ATPase subunit type 1 TsaE [Phycisphaerales bacterium]
MNTFQGHPMQTEFFTECPEQTQSLAGRLAVALPRGGCVALVGDLGAGKTCFVQGLLEGLGGDAAMANSPTFVISSEHPCGEQAQLAHIDAYRLSGEDELASIGWSELVADPETWIAVEWADRIAGQLPASSITVTIEHVGQSQRRIIIKWPPAAGALPDWLQNAASSQVCVVCGVAIDQDSIPFCSDRCKMADLGRWFSGSYTLSRPLKDVDWEDA